MSHGQSVNLSRGPCVKQARRLLEGLPKGFPKGFIVAPLDWLKIMSRKELATIRKSDNAEIRIGADYYKGRAVIDVRVWYRPAGGDWTPSRKGITFDADKLPAVVAGMVKAMEAIG